MLLVAVAMVFLVVLFLLKATSFFENKEEYQAQQSGLTYSSATIGDLINRDTDGDGIPDWEENLWGTDPTKKETTPGTPDSIAIDKMKTTQSASTSGGDGQSAENLTQTDQFSRDLFATVAAASSDGQPLDQTTADKISSSLADHIENSPPGKIFTIANIKITSPDTKQTVQKYSDTVDSIYTKYHINKGVLDILQEFSTNEENTDILLQLDPIISQEDKIINELLKVQVPRSLAVLHLDLINSSERVNENIRDIKLLDSDSIVALSAISQYEKNTAALQTAANNLMGIVKARLVN